MNTSLNWIKDLVPGLECTDQEYMDAMTLSGTKVEQGVRLDKDLDKIVIGKVEKVEQHPDADKLVICQVNIGQDELIQIVTGAPNVFEGAKVPVVLDGGRVAGGHDGKLVEGGVKIKKGKLRGVESYGMMCSIDELGSTTEMFPDAAEDGLYILPDDAVVGESAVSYLGLDDLIVEYEVTSNRVDCFSILGIAREAAATFDKKFVPPVVKEVGNSENVNDFIKVRVENNDLCKRYTARVVKNVKFAPSPKWMQNRLRAQGIRPINNLVDITNYVMEEFGQPMHAYDLSTISGNEIVVNTAKDGDEFVTLDGQTRKLDENILMINDGEKPVGIAGIMGGENSMITENVKDVLFEAACFDGTNIRLSSKKLGMRTDASSKFEKGLDPNLALVAMNRACQLIEELGVGEVVGGAIDIYPVKREGVKIPFEPEKYNKLLGTDIDKDTMISYFKKIDLVYNAQTNEIEVPSWRQDLWCDADIAEEVIRFYGYDKVPTTLPNGQSTTGKISFKHYIEKMVKNTVEHCGFSQGMTYSFESPKVFDKLLLDKDDESRKAIKIANPLGEDYSIMRTLSVNGMMTSLSTNFGRRNQNVRLYELGNVYLPKQLPITELPDEKMKLTLGMYGEGDFFDMKGFIEEVFESVGMRDKVEYSPESKLNFLHPGRQANVIYNGEVIGYIGEVHPTVASNYAIKGRVYLAVLDMESITKNASFDYKYKQIVNFPASTRDLSMVVPKDVLVGDIEKIFDQRGGKYLESYKLFDIYEGEQIKEGFKSVAYSLVFRGKEKNLEENDITKAMKKILNGLEGLGIELRA